MNCAICKHPCCFIERYKDTPSELMREYDSDKLHTCDSDIYRCPACEHMQISFKPGEKYYHEYTMGSFWGSSFIRLREKQLERVSALAPGRRHFLDIGCGMGHYLALAQKHFSLLYGVEPSKPSAVVARQKGFSVLQDHFHDGLHFEVLFDAISMIEVLEHIEDPLATLSFAARWLDENGILIVEVPNGQRIFEKRLYYNLSTDHIHYFSISSLTKLVTLAGLTVVCVQEADNPNLLELYARKAVIPAESFSHRRQFVFEQIISRIPDGARLAAWGAGAEAATFLAAFGGKIAIDCLFDNDPAKDGHQLAHIPIKLPTAETVCAYDMVLLFANSHKEQIQKQLNQLGFSGSLLSFNE